MQLATFYWYDNTPERFQTVTTYMPSVEQLTVAPPKCYHDSMHGACRPFGKTTTQNPIHIGPHCSPSWLCSGCQITQALPPNTQQSHDVEHTVGPIQNRTAEVLLTTAGIHIKYMYN